MYTELIPYQMIIAMLKKYNVKKCVLSAGSRNVPFVHSVEKDDYFQCYSVVDERSAGYFALGISQESNEPVVISCTSSTATCNYWPPVAEAFYQNVPLIILTSDRNPSMLGQWEDQMIDQVGMYDRHVRKSINLPIINDEDDIYYCERLLNEAFLELNHHGTGPIHINIPMKSYNNSFNVKILPSIKKIERVELKERAKIEEYKKRLLDKKRILVVCGQNSFVSEKLKKEISIFFEKYNSAISVEYMSNIDFADGINLNVGMDSRFITTKKMKELLPDLVISFGGNVFNGVKEQLRKFYKEIEHWSIQADGKVVDLFKSLSTIFECTAEEFFSEMNDVDVKFHNNKIYNNILQDYINGIKYPEFSYSHVKAIKMVVENIPEESILHLSINDSIRITNFFKLKRNIKTYANIGTHGIDGCLSSFLGQAVSTNKPAFLVIGDLAYFYDMNATRLRHIKPNVHILLINNDGGSEFYFNRMWKDKYSDLHTTARHKTKAQAWVESNNFAYLSAHDNESLEKSVKKFLNEDFNKPVFLEVFTEMKTDSDEIYKFFDISRPRDFKSETIRKTKELVKKTIGQEKAEKIASKLGIKK